jgi:hypothetical protein
VRLLVNSGAYAADLSQEILLIAQCNGYADVVGALVQEGAENADLWMGLSAADTRSVVSSTMRESVSMSDQGSTLVRVSVASGTAGRSSSLKAAAEQEGEEVLPASRLY